MTEVKLGSSMPLRKPAHSPHMTAKPSR
jgi:hypothetical protein